VKQKVKENFEKFKISHRNLQDYEETRVNTAHACHVQPYQQDRKLKQATYAPIQFSSTSS